MSDDRSADTAWIARRYQCSLAWILDNIHQIASANVGQVNQLSCQAVQDHPFCLEGKVKQGAFEVFGWPIGSKKDGSPPDRVTFRIDGDRITVSPNIVVTRRWDAFEEECFLDVLIDGKSDVRRYTAAKVVQLALEPLFFA